MARKPNSFRQKDVNGPPGGEPWYWISAELHSSPAWKARSRYCITLLEFLQREHMAHGGQENGDLLAPYAQIQKAGIPRGCIRPAIEEAEALHLIEVKRGGKKNLVEQHLNRYRLTFYATRDRTEAGKPFFSAPTDEWKTITEDRAVEIEREMRERRRLGKRGKKALKNSFSEPHGGTVSEPHGGSVSEPHGGTERTEHQRFRSEPHGGTAYNILGGDDAVPSNVVALSGIGVAGSAGRRSASTTPSRPDEPLPLLDERHRAEGRGSRDHSPLNRSLPGQLDLEAAVEAAGGYRGSGVAPRNRLRDDLDTFLGRAPRGTAAKLAARIGISRPQLVNFRRGVYDLNAGAATTLREILDVELAA